MLIDRGLLNGQDEQALLFGAAAGGDTLYGEETSIIGNWTDEDGDRGDAAVPPPPHQHLNRRRTGPSHHTGTVHRRDSSNTTFSESIAREMKLMINPKWIAMNPKWTPSDGTALGGVPPANASVSSSASLSASASTKTPASTSAVSQSATKTSSAATSTTSSAVGSSESVAWVLPSPPSSTCATMYTDTSGGGVYGAQVGNVPWSPRPSTFVVRGGNKLYLDGKEFRIVGPSMWHLCASDTRHVLTRSTCSQTFTGLDLTRTSTGRRRIRLTAGSARRWPSRSPWARRLSEHTPLASGEDLLKDCRLIATEEFADTVSSLTSLRLLSTGHPLTLWPSAYNTNSKAVGSASIRILQMRETF